MPYFEIVIKEDDFNYERSQVFKAKKAAEAIAAFITEGDIEAKYMAEVAQSIKEVKRLDYRIRTIKEVIADNEDSDTFAVMGSDKEYTWTCPYCGETSGVPANSKRSNVNGFDILEWITDTKYQMKCHACKKIFNVKEK